MDFETVIELRKIFIQKTGNLPDRLLISTEHYCDIVDDITNVTGEPVGTQILGCDVEFISSTAPYFSSVEKRCKNCGAKKQVTVCNYCNSRVE